MENSPTFDNAWSTIPSTAAPPQLLYLDTLRASDFGQFYKRQSFDLLDVQSGHRDLDVGCGPGDDVRALAERVGASGRVMGIDSNGAMIQEAASGVSIGLFPSSLLMAMRLHFPSRTIPSIAAVRTGSFNIFRATGCFAGNGFGVGGVKP